MNVQVHVEKDLLQSLPNEVRETVASAFLANDPSSSTRFTSAELWRIQRSRRKATAGSRKIDPVV